MVCAVSSLLHTLQCVQKKLNNKCHHSLCTHTHTHTHTHSHTSTTFPPHLENKKGSIGAPHTLTHTHTHTYTHTHSHTHTLTHTHTHTHHLSFTFRESTSDHGCHTPTSPASINTRTHTHTASHTHLHTRTHTLPAFPSHLENPALIMAATHPHFPKA